jgi:hypothetical protein
MDYREIENRLARNQEMIKERQNDRIIEDLKNADKAQRRNRLVGLWSLLASFRVRKPQPQPHVQLKPQRQVEHR